MKLKIIAILAGLFLIGTFFMPGGSSVNVKNIYEEAEKAYQEKKYQEAIDKYIETASEHWKLGRTTYIDRSILRLGVFEMLFSQDVPPKVAIDEAIEMAKKYGNEESKDFINGILDRIFKESYKKIEAEKLRS